MTADRQTAVARRSSPRSALSLLARIACAYAVARIALEYLNFGGVASPRALALEIFTIAAAQSVVYRLIARG